MAWRILLIKPYQPIDLWMAAPPVGLLTLAAVLRAERDFTVRFVDFNVRRAGLQALRTELAGFQPHVVGFSALNFQLHAAADLAAEVKRLTPATLTVLGGPVTHRRSAELLKFSGFDWIFEGEAERSFPQALRTYFSGGAVFGIAGLSLRENGNPRICQSTDRIPDLDAIPMPAWDLCEFDRYAREPNGNLIKKHRRYAYLFTSRGCPYKCAYCHDIFGKKFYAGSADRVLTEIDLLHDTYGIREFHIIDDIFNFEPERLSYIMKAVTKKYGNRLAFCFPNGMRADILTPALIDQLADAGTLSVAVAIETASRRLQRLIKKHLQIERAISTINYASQRGIIVKGFFMLGFPTETLAEMENTVQLALRSRLTLAHFFAVTPQPGSPLYELALHENPETEFICDPLQQYNADRPWYENSYGFPLRQFIARAYRRFYAHPSRMLRIVRRVPWRSYAHAVLPALRSVISVQRRAAESAAANQTTRSAPQNLRHTAVHGAVDGIAARQ
ncbi:MAG: B12-binding domain-containing radical SAM protein [Leptospiraceae bacterium]|nr:B12-binding domain-containing radical SAM protein [Leptospiraceae bacterium]